MHYTGTIWRPPYEGYNALIQVTAGCTHHKCKFCTLYEDIPFKFRMSPLLEVEEDLKEMSRFYINSPRVFFTGGNPFALHFDKLKALAELVKKYFPGNRTIGSFARITDITTKSVNELKELRTMGYNGITIGVESGDDEALDFMNKGFTTQDVLNQCRKLDEAGMEYNFFYLAGISGAGRGEVAARKTAEIFNQLNPRIIDSSMMTISHTSELYQEICKGNWREEGEIEKLVELRTLIEYLNLNANFRTDGVSNLIQVRGNLLTDKKRMISDLNVQIKMADENELRRYRESLDHL